MSRLSVTLREWNRRTAPQRTRLRALIASLTPGPWRPRGLARDRRFATERLDETLQEACRRMGLVMVGTPVRGYFTNSRGATVRASDGELCWVKVNGVPSGPAQQELEGETSAAAIRGVPKPTILEVQHWTQDSVYWRAILMTLAPASAKTSPLFSRRRHGISDRWIGELKQAIQTIATIPTERRRFDPDWMSAAITKRFGAETPHICDDWRTAHGDLHWGNITVPELMLLDWELWGLAPRGFDAACLVAFTSPDPVLTRRLQSAFADELDTPSGKVAQLVICAGVLRLVEAGHHDPRFHAPVEALARHTLRGG